MSRGAKGRPWRYVARLAMRNIVLALPFAIFFSFLFGNGWEGLGGYYLVSLVLACCISITTEVNRLWVLPRLLPTGRAEGGSALVLEIVSFGVAALVGSITGGAILEATIARGAFSSGRAVALFFAFSLIFVLLFLGLIYAMRFQRRFADRVRAEAEAKAKDEQELRIAGEIQRALLPGRPRSTRAFSAAGAAIACRTIGGDFFDYFDLPGGRLGFALGDVAGKGPPAALLAAMVQGIFTSHADDDEGPARTIERVNRVLSQRIVEGRFATIFYAVLSPEGQLVSCNAGNNPPLLVGRDGTVRRLERGGLPIGPFEEATFEEEVTALRNGDTLVLYSDGVSDAADPNNEPFGEERLLASLERARGLEPKALIDRVLGDVRSFAS
ncbi:MAG: serine/threonine-protein phosphatase, partial [Elusimicrobia bacterium]|nr:serine/threonine-protein phosphatase [Elusimicrobiota bacterium]